MKNYFDKKKEEVAGAEMKCGAAGDCRERSRESISESGFGSLTKSLVNSGRRKRLFLGACAAVFMAVAVVSIFYGCKKDPVNGDVVNIKARGDVALEDLREYEHYTPDEIMVNEKLLLFTNYVNHPEEFPMPNMEIKEAIWFMETFFNMGVCEKQKQFVDYSHSKRNYSITIPFEWNGNGMFLNGQYLQEVYHNLLNTVAQDILPEYALNFGDVYVQEVNAGTVIIGIDVMYGSKKEKSFDEEGRIKIVSSNYPFVYYPFTADPTTFQKSNFLKMGKGDKNDKNAAPWLSDKNGAIIYCRDFYMESVLNSEYIFYTPTSVEHCGNDRMAKLDIGYLSYRCDGSGVASGSCDCSLWMIHKHGCIQSCPANETPLLTKNEYIFYGKQYKNYIYANLCNNIPAGYSPFLADCFFLWTNYVSMDYPELFWQDFGLEYICIFGDIIGVESCRDNVIYMDPIAVPYLID